MTAKTVLPEPPAEATPVKTWEKLLHTWQTASTTDKTTAAVGAGLLLLGPALFAFLLGLALGVALGAADRPRPAPTTRTLEIRQRPARGGVVGIQDYQRGLQESAFNSD